MMGRRAFWNNFTFHMNFMEYDMFVAYGTYFM